MNIRRKLRAHTEVHTGPLNDILFILLLFFLIASTLANPNLVQVNNPKGTKDSRAKQDIIVSINSNNEFYIGQTLIPSYHRTLPGRGKRSILLPWSSTPIPPAIMVKYFVSCALPKEMAHGFRHW